MSAAVVPYETAIATAAARLDDALRELHAIGLAGGPQAVAAQSSGLRNGTGPDDLAAAFLALPRENPQAARAA